MRRRSPVLVSMSCALALLVQLPILVGCRRDGMSTPTPSADPHAGAQGIEPPPPAAPIYPFPDVAQEVGIDFVNFIGATGEYYFPENMGSGCALLDYDNDGDLDAYLLQGSLLGEGKTYEDCLFPPQCPLPPRNRLYRNELISDGRDTGHLHFVDVTEESGAGDTAFAMGVAVGDYDNDGDVDMYVTNFGPDVLLRNNGDGTFSDVTAEAGLGDPRWTISTTFFDYNNDTYLDLVTVAYCDFTIATNKECFTTSKFRDYCHPHSYRSVPTRLYHNNGDGTFRDATAEVGIATTYGHGLGVASADFDENGWMDLIVANDGDANQMWLNNGGRFSDAALLSGAAFNGSGAPEASMGIAINDFDDDGDRDYLLTHLVGETNTLYENLGGALFRDATTMRRLGAMSLANTTFGVDWIDVDHDADLDLFMVSGNVRFVESMERNAYPYQLPNQLVIHGPDGTFEDRTADAGPDLAIAEVSRGLATGDVDNDGDVDVLVANNNGRARLFRNDLAEKNNWIILRVIDEAIRRDALGAAVRLKLSDGRTLTRYVAADGSYCSAKDPRVHVAWPLGIEPISLEIITIDKRVVKVEDPQVRSITTVRVPPRSKEAES